MEIPPVPTDNSKQKRRNRKYSCSVFNIVTVPPSIPDVHGELLLGYEPLAALRAHVLPAVVALVGLLTQVQPTPE